MRVLVDTNVVIDFLTTREPFYKAASSIMEKCANGELDGYIAFHSIPNLWYILRKTPEEKRREWLLDVCSILRVKGASHDNVLKAIRMKDFDDLEDCLQDRCAEEVGAKLIITRNVNDFEKSVIPAISPEDFLDAIGRGEQW